MREAPASPTTEDLATINQLNPEAAIAIVNQRLRISHGLRNRGFLGMVGGCSVTEQDESTLMMEGSDLYLMQELNDSLLTGQRHCVWKPRTSLADWHGEETTNPAGAYGLITRQSNRYHNVVMEVAHSYHMERYGNKLAFVWSGARSISRPELVIQLALADPLIPFGVKNGLGGELEPVMSIIEEINSRRADKMDNPAPAVLIWRGGSNILTPDSWEAGRQRAYDITEGCFIDDSAHGSSMAHDRNKQKSNYGQQAAIEHIVELSQRGYLSLGALIEASDVASLTDPNLPFSYGLTAITQLAAVALNSKKDIIKRKYE